MSTLATYVQFFLAFSTVAYHVAQTTIDYSIHWKNMIRRIFHLLQLLPVKTVASIWINVFLKSIFGTKILIRFFVLYVTTKIYRSKCYLQIS